MGVFCWVNCPFSALTGYEHNLACHSLRPCYSIIHDLSIHNVKTGKDTTSFSSLWSARLLPTPSLRQRPSLGCVIISSHFEINNLERGDQTLIPCAVMAPAAADSNVGQACVWWWAVVTSVFRSKILISSEGGTIWLNAWEKSKVERQHFCGL